MTAGLGVGLFMVVFTAERAPELQFGLKALRAQELARLERATGPLEQNVLVRADLTVDVAHRKVVGRAVVSFTAREAGDEVLLRTTPNAAHAEAVQLLNATARGKPVKLERPDATLWRVVLPEVVEIGDEVQVEVQLQAKVPPFSKERGEAHDHGAFSGSADFVSLVGLLPMMPPTKPGGELFSPPSGMGDLSAYEPTSFFVSVSVPRGYGVVMPGAAVGEVPDRQGRVRFTATTVGAREFPVFVTKGFEVQRVVAGEVTVELHAPKGRPNAKMVLEHAAFAVKALEQRLGPYPYTTLKVVEAPLAQGVGGMEFPGLVTIAQASMSGADDPLSSLGLGELTGDPAVQAMVEPMLKGFMRSSLEFTVLHEVAHQYTACLVGSDAVDEPVADEPVTQHLALLVLEWRRGKKAANEVREGQVKMAYQLWRMMGGRDGKANRPTGEFDSTMEYAALVYGKAPLLFDAQRALVGDEAWERALKAYVEQHRYRWVTPRTLTEVAAKVAPAHGRQLEALRVRWLEERHGDEDVGTASLPELLKQGGAGGPGLELDADTMKMIEELFKALEP